MPWLRGNVKGEGEGREASTYECDNDSQVDSGHAWCFVRSSADRGALISFLRSLDGAVK